MQKGSTVAAVIARSEPSASIKTKLEPHGVQLCGECRHTGGEPCRLRKEVFWLMIPQMWVENKDEVGPLMRTVPWV